MLSLIKALAVLFYLQKENVHVQVQNVTLGQSEKLHEKCRPSPQKKLRIEPDAGRDPALAGALLSSASGVHCEVLHDTEREEPLGLLQE